MQLVLSLSILLLAAGTPVPAAAAAGPTQPRDAASRAALRTRFRQALELENTSRCRAAAPLFERLWREDPLLRPYHAYHAAACHLRAGNGGQALRWAQRVGSGTIPEAEAAVIRIEVLVALRRWPAVLEQTGRFTELFPAGPRRAEAEFQQAVALEAVGRAAEAASLLRAVWAGSRSETWSARADARLSALQPRLSAAERVAAGKRAGDWVARGLVLFERHQNQESEAAFASALDAPGLTPALACQARFHQAQSVWKQRTRARALPLFVTAQADCQAAGDPDLEARAMYQRGRCLVSTGQGKQSLAQFARAGGGPSRSPPGRRRPPARRRGRLGRRRRAGGHRPGQRPCPALPTGGHAG